MSKRKQVVASRKRVIKLLNAISDIRRCDLFTVLELDKQTGPYDSWHEPKSRIARARDGGEIAQILENQLVDVMIFGEITLPSSTKGGFPQIGGRRF
jgi:hypothetical protein